MVRRLYRTFSFTFTVLATTTETTEEAVPISAKHLERLERVRKVLNRFKRSILCFPLQRKEREKRQAQIAIIAKEALKPAFKKRDITKEEYKIIMKKVVTKVNIPSDFIFRKRFTQIHCLFQATDANEVDRTRIRKMIHGYVTKYRTEHERNTSKHSKISNGNGS